MKELIDFCEDIMVKTFQKKYEKLCHKLYRYSKISYQLEIKLINAELIKLKEKKSKSIGRNIQKTINYMHINFMLIAKVRKT